MGHEYERGEHHCEIPIVDAAIGATAVLHKPSLKGTEEEDANHIADAVGESDEYKYPRINNIKKIKRADDAV